MTLLVHRQEIANDRDLVDARSRAMAIAAELGFPVREQTQIAAALSEIGRNALIHAGNGEIQFVLEPADAPKRLMLRVTDRGPGIADVQSAQVGIRRDPGAGRGMGMVAAQRLVDRFKIESTPGKGTAVEMVKDLPVGTNRVSKEVAGRLQTLARNIRAEDPVRVMQAQTRELLTSLAAERERQEDLKRLNQELEETNRGVVALYAELDEKAEYLRRASDLKSRFLSHMSHEFRTPLSSILALSRLLLDQVDGPLMPEQQKQVTYIRKSAEGLLELINDLLDIAKVEAGKLSVNCTTFALADLFGGLRGALRPLTRDAVNIIFESKGESPDLNTDEGKVAQILRNFIANAIRFTEEGSITVLSCYHADRDLYEFAVKDTGVGIAPADQTMIFEEFSQIEGALQRESRGTGLGLPLSKQLAELLGGHIQLKSELGKGSTFTLWIPRSLETVDEPDEGPAAAHRKVLVIDDEDTFRYIIRQLLGGIDGLKVSEARTGVEGIARARQERPDVIILDVLMPDRGGQEVLRILRADPEMKAIPVLVTTSLPLSERLLAELRDANNVMAKQNLSSESLRAALAQVLPVEGVSSNGSDGGRHA